MATFAGNPAGAGQGPASPPWASGAALGAAARDRIGSGRHWHEGDSASANRLADNLFADESQTGGEGGYWWELAPAIRVCSPCALRQMQQTDVVVYDRLVSDEVMALVRRDAKRVSSSAKQAGNHCVPQEDQPALAGGGEEGQRVVRRLKG